MGNALGLPERINAVMEKHIRGGFTREPAKELNLPVKGYTLHTLEERIIIHADRLVDIITEDLVSIGVLPAIIKKDTVRWPRSADRRTIMRLSGAIVLGGIVGPLLLLIAVRFANAGSVSLWLNLEFVATVIPGHFIFREL